MSVGWTRFGPPAEQALAERIDAMKGGDPLAPVTVIVRASHVGLSARRALASRVAPDGRLGVLNVSFSTVTGLAENIAGGDLVAQGRLPLHDTALRAAIGAALVEAAVPGLSDRPSTIEAVLRTYKELRRCGTPGFASLKSGTARARAIGRVLEAVRRTTAPVWFDNTDLLEAARRGAVSDPDQVFAHTGPLVIWLPGRFETPEASFLAALGRAGRCHMVCGVTGDEEADEATARQATHLAGGSSMPAPDDLATGCDVSVLSAPTADTEVLLVVREVMAKVRAGVPLERMAVAHPGTRQYAELLHTTLARAGIPFHGAGCRPLSSLVAGRMLLGALALAECNWRREDVVRWLATGPLLVDGRRVPAARWDLLSAEAGVIEGADGWRTRLSRLADARRAEAVQGDPDRVDEEGWRQALSNDARDVEALVAALDWVEARLSSCPGDWSSWAVWADRLLRALSGGPNAWSGWPAGERAAADAVAAAIDRIGALGRTGLPCTPERARAALEAELGTPAPQTARFGVGLWVAPISAVPGVSLEALFVVGVNDGVLPALPVDDVILPDRDRPGGADGSELPRRGAIGTAVRHEYVAALAGASTVQLSFSRGSQRDGRELRPSRWVLDALVQRRGLSERLYLSNLPQVAPGDGYRIVPSFAAAVSGRDEPFGVADRDLHSLAEWTASGRPLARHPLAGPATRLRRGVAMLDGRGRGFTRFEGRAGPAAAPDAWTASSLAQFAACPRRYFFESVLRVAPRPISERATATDRALLGSLVHRILERFVRPQIGRTPGQGPDDPFDEARLLELADQEASGLEAAGLVGPPGAWEVERIRLRRMLRAFARADRQWRMARGVITVAVEQPFGPNDKQRVEVRTESGHVVHCQGRIDRVDVTPDGSIVVTDYKTGRVPPAADADERLDGGRAVQLPLYATAVASEEGRPTEAAYWGLGERLGCVRHEQSVDTEARRALARVVGTVAETAAAGVFPAHPVAPGGARPSPCTFCPFTAVCPTQRVRAWEHIRRDDAVGPYAELVA